MPNSNLKQTATKAGLIVGGTALGVLFLPWWVTAAVGGVAVYSQKDKIKDFFG